MKKEDLFELGYNGKTVGNKGEVNLHLDTDQPEYYQKMTNLFVEIKGTLIPYSVEHIKIKGQKATVKYKDIDTKDVAELLQSSKVFLPLDFLPKLKGNQFYFHEVIGFKVVDKIHGEIGIVDQVIDHSIQAIFSILKDGQEILIPITDEILKKLDRKNKIIEIEAPEGLIDIYL
jgi:16S rRNA processing protein RimM